MTTMLGPSDGGDLDTRCVSIREKHTNVACWPLADWIQQQLMSALGGQPWRSTAMYHGQMVRDRGFSP